MFFIPIFDTETARPIQSSETTTLTTDKLINTAAFIKEHHMNPTYEGIPNDSLIKQTTRILQIQSFELCQWCLLRARIQHPFKFKRLDASCSKITPWNFVIEDSDISLYLRNPKFLWRFSVNNYEYFCRIFARGRKEFKSSSNICDPCLRGDEVLTYDKDDSQVVPYYINHAAILDILIRYSLRKPIRECSKWYKMYDFEEMLTNTSSYKLTVNDKSEFKYSYEYSLQMIESDLSYATFVRILITGHTKDGAGPLLDVILTKEAEELERRKKRNNRAALQ